MRDPRPFIVVQNGTFLFVIHADSARHARTLGATLSPGSALPLKADISVACAVVRSGHQRT
jgi:hypothetical protein